MKFTVDKTALKRIGLHLLIGLGLAAIGYVPQLLGAFHAPAVVNEAWGVISGSIAALLRAEDPMPSVGVAPTTVSVPPPNTTTT